MRYKSVGYEIENKKLLIVWILGDKNKLILEKWVDNPKQYLFDNYKQIYEELKMFELKKGQSKK